MDSSSSQHVPTSAVSSDAVTVIAQLQAQLSAANSQIVSLNAEGNRVVNMLNAEKSKTAAAAAAAAVDAVVPSPSTRVKIPIAPQFKGEVGFGVDTWIRRLTKQFDYYGASSFPNDEMRIRFAVMYLEGSAMDWWDKIPAAEKSTMLVSWSKFVEALYSRFRPMQAAMLARARLSNLKQTGAVAAYVTLFLRELTPIDDMSTADQIFYFRAGLKSHIAQRVLEKLPKTLHEAMDIAVLADAHTNKMNGPQYNYSSSNRGASAYTTAPRSSSSHAAANSNDMDISNVNDHSLDDVRPPVFHEDDSASSSSVAAVDMTRELNRMKTELKKYQTQAAISAIGSSSSSSSAAQSGRVPGLSKEDFDYCFTNRLCLKCKKPGHRAAECRSKYQPLK
jgi:Ty3 transposon capsid-like protein